MWQHKALFTEFKRKNIKLYHLSVLKYHLAVLLRVMHQENKLKAHKTQDMQNHLPWTLQPLSSQF